MADQIPINPPKPDEKVDIIVPIGNQAGASKERDVVFDENYEDMTEDFIGTLNHAITQGMKPIQVLYAQASAFSIVLGCFIRAGLTQAEVGKLLMMVGRNAAVSSKMVQIMQNQTVGQAVTDVIRNTDKKAN